MTAQNVQTWEEANKTKTSKNFAFEWSEFIVGYFFIELFCVRDDVYQFVR